MSEEGKKISFGFSKLAKPKTTLISNNKTVKSDESVQYIECVEDKNIKVINEGPKKPDFLVIPMPKLSVSDGKRRELLHKILNNACDDDNEEKNNTLIVENVSTPSDALKKESLDEIAAREIIEDLKKTNDTDGDNQNFTVLMTDDKGLSGKESTIDDYDSIPVEKFGMAMLRGMGWAPGKGIGKTEQVVTTKQPVLRPKGLGLGADKVIKKEQTSSKDTEPLKLVKGSHVKIIAGAHKDLFGEIIGFDDETGRLIIKMALGSNILTFNEFMVELISKDDFIKNSKVINVKKYEEYKMKENSGGVIVKESSDEEESKNDSKLNYKTKYKPSRSSHSSSDEKEASIKSKTKDQCKTSIERYNSNDSSKRSNKSSLDKSPERHPSKHKSIYENSRKNRDSSSPDQRSSSKYSKQNLHKERSTHKLASKEYSRSKLKSCKHKESKNHSSSDSSSSGRSRSRDKKSNKKRRQSSSSTDSSSHDEYRKKSSSRSDYKKKCKKNKEKKSRKRSRSCSRERKRHDKSSKKHRKSMYND